MSSPNPHKTKVADSEATDRLLDALRGRARGQTALVRVTEADAVAMSGLPNAQAEPALRTLVARYRSHVAVTEEGELVYAFDPSLERRDRVTLKERLAKAGAIAYRGFQVAFKVWIMVTLVVYVVAFVAMMIGLMFARSSDDRDDRRGGGGLPWLWFWLMPDLAPRYGYGYDDPWGRRPGRRIDARPRKRFYNAVFDFVFGPPVAKEDPLAGDRRFVAYLRSNRGRVTTADLVALTGLSLEEADEELTRLMVEYDGEVDVKDDGTLVYAFAGLLPSAGAVAPDTRLTWDQPVERRELTGNSGGANAVIGGFAAFNLLASLSIGPAFLERLRMAGDPTALFFVTWFPFVFSLIFFAVPSVRWLAERRRTGRERTRALRRALLKEIWARPGEPLDPVALAKEGARRVGATEAEGVRALEQLLKDLDGDVDTDSAGALRYVFPRLDRERRAVEAARSTADERPLGPVIFSSEDEKH
jgi:hypothetical protein